MTDNKKLGERLRAVIDTAVTDAYTAASQMNVTAEDHAATEREVNEAEAVGVLVVAALEAAEKAHTQTDDEVNAVALAYWGASVTYDRERLRAALAGFRRSEVPEPSARVEFPFTHDGVTLEQDDGGMWIRINDVEPARWLGPKAIAALRVAWAEPQGEPSDAQADAAQRGYHAFTFGPDEVDAFLTPERLAKGREAWKAALRAAGGVR